MRLPLPRLSLALLMALIALAAAGLAVLRRPYPTGWLSFGVAYQLRWSDGSDTTHAPPGPTPARLEEHGPLLILRWSDGSRGWYLRVLPARRRPVPSEAEARRWAAEAQARKRREWLAEAKAEQRRDRPSIGAPDRPKGGRATAPRSLRGAGRRTSRPVSRVDLPIRPQ